LFYEDIFKIEGKDIRYTLRWNPVRVRENNDSRKSKRCSGERIFNKKNIYFHEHKRSKIETVIKDVRKKIIQLKIDK